VDFIHSRQLVAPPDIRPTDKTVHSDYDASDARQYQVEFHFALTDLVGTYWKDGVTLTIMPNSAGLHPKSGRTAPQVELNMSPYTLGIRTLDLTQTKDKGGGLIVRLLVEVKTSYLGQMCQISSP
jgi:hypothetical protein